MSQKWHVDWIVCHIPCCWQRIFLVYSLPPIVPLARLLLWPFLSTILLVFRLLAIHTNAALRLSFISISSLYHNLYFCQLCCVLKVSMYKEMPVLQRIRCLVDSRFHAENCRKLWASHYPLNIYQFVYARHSGRWKPKTKIGEPSETSTIHPNKHTRIHACISCEANVTRDMNPKLTCPFSSVKITTVLYLASICQHAFCENANAWCWSLWNDRKRDGEECGDGRGGWINKHAERYVWGREWERGKQKDNTHEFNHY